MVNFVDWKKELFLELDNSWWSFFKIVQEKEYFINILKTIYDEYSKNICYPEVKDIFRIFKITKVSDLKVVIIGQDPYHNKNQADGIAFSVKNDKITPSLRNIFLELKNDIGLEYKKNCLDDWVKQGVFLMNTVWTVQEHKPNSHKKIGWLDFTNDLINFLIKNKKLIFVLLGENAKKYKNKLQDLTILESSHPSPFSYKKGFEGSKIFSKINKHLDIINIKEIVWVF
ncbi:uracil-DNA glycosylase [Spiroplasma endosymbiont of Amphibalanus improvisus]|uniref:uracil-DNA glycosylase n=1 Tax=Spiroplasma endosymbiont of Amphibalanus improvisus TaxID=3066327 RepID=UPI00313BDE37